MADEDEGFDVASLLDAAFGAAPKKEEEPVEEPEIQEAESSATATAKGEAEKGLAVAEEPATESAEEPESPATVTAKREAKQGLAVAEEPATEPAEAEPQTLAQEPEQLPTVKAKRKAKQDKVPAADEPAAEPAEPLSAAAADEPEPEPAPSLPTKPLKLTRGRLAAAATVVVGVAAATVVVFSGGGSGKAATPNGAASTLPSVNPQAFYPVQSASPFETGAKSALADADLLAAVSGCGGCKLVTRANGFTPDGGVLALFRTGEPEVGKSNVKLVVVGADGKLVWSAPDGFKALSAGLERFSVDAAGNFYLALPGAKSGQVLVALAWRDGKVQDIGGLADPRIKSDSIVGVLPQGGAAGGEATIVSQTTAGVPDADTGGLIESQYRVRDGAPVLVACRRHVGESGQWIAFQPSADGCTHWPAGPVGPPDDDGAAHTAPAATAPSS